MIHDPLFSLTESRVLITSGGGAICSLVAKSFLERGATVVLHDLSLEKVDVVRKSLAGLGGKVFKARDAGSTLADTFINESSDVNQDLNLLTLTLLHLFYHPCVVAA